MPNERGDRPVVHTKKHVARLERERQQTRLILYGFIGILVLVVGLLVYGYIDEKYLQLKRPVAKVGDVEISTRDFETRVKLQRNQMLGTYDQYYQLGQAFGMDVSSQLQQIQAQLDSPTQIGQTVLDQMVNEELIIQEAKKRGLTVSEDEIETAIRSDLRFFPNGSPTPSITPTIVTFPTLSDETLKLVTATATFPPTPVGTLTPTGTLESAGTPLPSPSPTASATPGASATPAPTLTPFPTATPYTLEGYQTEYKAGLERLGAYGLSEDQYRKIYESNLLREQLYAIVTADVPYTEEQVWARHILVADEATAKAVIERLNKGEDFAALAMELSLDTGSGQQGGDLGWFGQGVMVPEFEAAAFALKVGEISAPVQSNFGFHIIQVLAKQDRPLSESDLQTARDRVFADFLATLREEYNVEIFDTWKQHVPTEPSFSSLATEAALTPPQ